MAEITKKLWDKAEKSRIPLTAAFELLPTCNLACKMCYVRKTKKEAEKEGGLLPADFFLRAAKEAGEMGLLFPLLTGGEPFLRQDFQEIMAGMLQMGLQVSINSNGTLINEETAKWLGKNRPLRLNITLYGAGADTYQKLCGNGEAYDHLRRAVDWLQQYHVPIKFNTSITKYNIGDLESMMQYAHSVGSPIQVSTYMFPPVRRNENMIGENDRLSPEGAALARVKADFLQNEPEWFLGQARRYRDFIPPTDEMLKAQAAAEGHEMSCRAGRCSFWLDWQGNMGNCGMYSAAKVKLFGCSVKEAWDVITEETNNIRYSPVCTNCPNFRLCHACIAMVYNECGDTGGRPEYLCRMHAASAKYYQEYAKKLREGRPSVEGKTFAAPKEWDCDLEKRG